MNDIFSINFQSGGLIIYILIGLAALGISWWSYANVTPRVSAIKKYLLIGLRSLGILLIGILLIEPLISIFSERTTGNRLGVVIDISSSMNIDEENNKRREIAADLFSEHIPSAIPAQFYVFSDTLIELKRFPDTVMFNGQATDIARIFTPTIADNDELGAILIVTDGAGNVGIDPLKAASTFDKPVYSMVIGGGIIRKDVFISRVDYPPIGYTNTEFTIEVEIGANGYRGETGQLEIRDGKRVLESQHVAFPPDGAFTTAEFKLSIADDGVKNFQAVLAKLDDETYADNNIRNFTIKFLKDKIDILILSSSLNWEYTYLKKALESDQHFDLTTAIAKRSDSFNINELPATLEAWKQIELVIAIDLNTRTVGAQLNNLKAAIEAGMGFLYLGGAQTMTRRLGKWDDILPVKAGSNSIIEDGEFFPVPGKQPRVRAILDIPGLRWEELPPLKVVMTGINLDENAFVLLDIINREGEHWPVLTGGRYKRGKTAAITGYPWWPRHFRPVSGAADISRIEKFWSNLVRWLVVREDLDKFNLTPNKTVYKLGEPTGFKATLFDDSYNLVAGARVMVVIADSSGARRELQLTGKAPGQYAGDFGSPAAGKYAYNAYAVVEGDTVAATNGSFIVESFSLEMENPSANYALMEQISAITGGKSYTAENFDQFDQELKLKTSKSEILSEYRLTGNMYLLIAIILLFVLEWGIRKFSQLA